MTAPLLPLPERASLLFGDYVLEITAQDAIGYHVALYSAEALRRHTPDQDYPRPLREYQLPSRWDSMELGPGARQVLRDELPDSGMILQLEDATDRDPRHSEAAAAVDFGSAGGVTLVRVTREPGSLPRVTRVWLPDEALDLLCRQYAALQGA